MYSIPLFGLGLGGPAGILGTSEEVSMSDAPAIFTGSYKRNTLLKLSQLERILKVSCTFVHVYGSRHKCSLCKPIFKFIGIYI